MKRIINIGILFVAIVVFNQFSFSQNLEKGEIIFLSKAEFLAQIYDYTSENAAYKGDIPAVVDFYADWCRPCRMMEPHLKIIAEEYAGKIKVYKVDLMVETQIAEDLEIRSIPTLYFFPLKGDPIMVLGYQDKEDLESIIKQELKP